MPSYATGKRNRSLSTRGSYSSKRYAKVPAHMRKYVQRAIRSSLETKSFFVNSGPTALDPTTTCAIYSLNRMGNGVNSTERVGDKIKAVKLKVKVLLAALHAQQTTNFIRVVVFKAGFALLDSTASSFLINGSGDQTTLTADIVNDTIAPWNIDSCKVLFDRVFDLTGQGTDGPGNSSVAIEIEKTLNHILEFSSDGSDATQNNFRLAIINREATDAALVAPVYVSMQSEFMFTDA